MNPIQIKFKLEEYQKQDKPGIFKEHLSVLMEKSIAKNEHDYENEFRKNVEIDESNMIFTILKQYNNNAVIEYKDATIGSINKIQVNLTGGSLIDFGWNCSIHLTSVEYTCIEVFPDSTFLCYKTCTNSDKELIFIKLEKMIKAIILPLKTVG